MKETTEQRIQTKFGMDAHQLLKLCFDKNLSVPYIATMISCSTSNLRRIMRRHNIKYIKVVDPVMLTQTSDFKNKNLNRINFLSRKWIETA